MLIILSCAKVELSTAFEVTSNLISDEGIEFFKSRFSPTALTHCAASYCAAKTVWENVKNAKAITKPVSILFNFNPPFVSYAVINHKKSPIARHGRFLFKICFIVI